MLPKATFHFSKDFFWGASYPLYLTPHQIVNNNWENWVNISPLQTTIQKPLGTGWKEDFEKGKSLGLNTILLTIDWSLVQPLQNQWNEYIVETYRKMVINLQEKKIQPIIILQHFSEPIWFFEQGGWNNKVAITYYLEYVKKMVSALKEHCSYWITFFEPNQYILNAHLYKKYPPGSGSISSAGKVYKNIRMAHNEAYKIIHQIQLESNVTLSPNFQNYFPARHRNLLDKLISSVFNSFYNHLFSFNNNQKNIFSKISPLKNNKPLFDFMLASFYGDQEIKASFNKPMQTLNLQTAKGLKKLLTWALSFKKPVYILSSNLNPHDATYLLTCLHTIWKTANINPHMRGFLYHSLVDGFEWDKYFDLPTGLFNKNTSQSQHPKRITNDVYKNILQNNSISYELVKTTNPHLINKLFP
ncbi:MAG: hypothetical protein CL609_06930 [Anaerolineaceae bacterium]|nr:hypothetical protein [Anaerolineaceae bacterium]